MHVRRAFRLTVGIVLLISGSFIGYSYATSPDRTTVHSFTSDPGRSTEVAPPRDNITVVATDSNAWVGRASDGPRARAELVGFRPNGSVLYYNDSHTRYWDVDPVPGSRITVEVMFADHLPQSECPATWNTTRRQVSPEVWSQYERAQADVGACTRNGVERVNLTTGEVTRVWSEITPGKSATRYHDADRVNETHLLVADIYLDRVFLVDTETGEVAWTWNASQAFDPSTGGPYPGDWTHINDIELLADGRIMVSVRNQDQVIFLGPDGLEAEWSLGADNDHQVLFEQHNPDFIPTDRGGPAVVVADSENNRVVEYQRTGGEWRRTWTWRDARLQWPRDADRLPNGHTLIADSNGDRVFEVDRRGNVVWSVNIAYPYEAERLGTADESTGGPSATRAGLRSDRGTLGDQVWMGLKDAIPGRYLNGVMYTMPVWIGIPELFAMVLSGLLAISWLVAEGLWYLTDSRRVPDLGLEWGE